MFCSVCGHQNDDDALFCKKCGDKLHSDMTQNAYQYNGQEPMSFSAPVNNSANVFPPVKREGVWVRFSRLHFAKKLLIILGISLPVIALLMFLLFVLLFSIDTGDSSTDTSSASSSQSANPMDLVDDSQKIGSESASSEEKVDAPPVKNESTELNGYHSVDYSDGASYEGNFVNGKRQGQGKLRYANGAYYEGGFYNDKWDGYGELTYANGNVYRGNFSNGLREDDNGVLVFADGTIHTGTFSNDKMTGYAEREYSNGVYKGNFVNGVRNGQGTFNWIGDQWDGDYYDGEWKNDQRTGYGEYYDYSEDNLIEGTFKNGKFLAAG